MTRRRTFADTRGPEDPTMPDVETIVRLVDRAEEIAADRYALLMARDPLERRRWLAEGVFEAIRADLALLEASDA